MRSLFHQSGLPYTFWVDTLHTVVYLINRLPCRVLKNHLPYSKFHNHPPNYQDLHSFGCLYFPCLTDKMPHKFAPRSTSYIFIGYSPNHKGYKCYDPHTSKVLISRHVVFNENCFPYKSPNHTLIPMPTSRHEIHPFLLVPHVVHTSINAVPNSTTFSPSIPLRNSLQQSKLSIHSTFLIYSLT